MKKINRTFALLTCIGLLSCGGSGDKKVVSPTLALSSGLTSFANQDIITAKEEFCGGAASFPDDDELAFGCFWAQMMLSTESDESTLLLQSFGEPAFDLETQILGDEGIFALKDLITTSHFPIFNYSDFNFPFASYFNNSSEESFANQIAGLLQKTIDQGLTTTDIQERIVNLSKDFIEMETYLAVALANEDFTFTLPKDLYYLNDDINITHNDLKLMMGTVKITIALLDIISAYETGLDISKVVSSEEMNLENLTHDLNGDGSTVESTTFDTVSFLTLIDKDKIINAEARIIDGLNYTYEGLFALNNGEASDLATPAVSGRDLSPTLTMIENLLSSYSNNTLTEINFPGASKSVKINLKTFFTNPPDAASLDASSGYPFIYVPEHIEVVETYFLDLLNGIADF